MGHSMYIRVHDYMHMPAGGRPRSEKREGGGGEAGRDKWQP